MRAALATALAVAFALGGAGAASAQDDVNVLVFHGPSDPTTTPGVAAIEDIGEANGFGVDATADAAQITPANLADYRAVVFLNTTATCSAAARRPRCSSSCTAVAASSASARPQQGEAGSTAIDQLLGARPRTDSPTTVTEQVVAVGDRVHPSTRDLPLELERSDQWYQWVTRPTGTVHTVARYRAPGRGGRRRHRHRRHGYADLVVPRHHARPLLLHRHGPDGGELRRGGVPTHLEGALNWAAGLVRGGCKATINANYQAQRIVNGNAVTEGLTSAASRTASPPRRTAGCSTSAVATAAPTPSAARCSTSRRSAASSTTPTRRWASAAARSTSGIPRRPTARRTRA